MLSSRSDLIQYLSRITKRVRAQEYMKGYFHRVFREVVIAKGNRKLVPPVLSFSTVFACIAQVPGSAVNNSSRRRRRVATCRNSCFSTAFPATVIFATVRPAAVGRDALSVAHPGAQHILYPLVGANKKPRESYSGQSSNLGMGGDSQCGRRETNERRYFVGQMKPCTGLKDIRASGNAEHPPEMMMYLAERAPDIFVALVIEVDAGRYGTLQRREGNEKIQPARRRIHIVPNFRACSLA